jgi:two-component system sensor histidine kinase CreC
MVSVRLRIIATFTFCAVLGFIFFLYLISQEVKPRLREALEEVLVENAYSLAAVVETLTEQEGQLNITVIQRAFQITASRRPAASIYRLTKENLDLRVYITDDKGRVLYHSQDESEVGADYSKWNDVFRTLQGKYGARTTRDIVDDPSSTVLYIAAPIVCDGGLCGVLSVGKPAIHNNRFIDTAKRELYLFGFVLALLGLIVSWFITLWVSRPIAKLRNYVTALKAGGDPPLPQLGNNEIGELANTLFEMKNSLEGRQYVHHYVQSLSHELKSPLSSIAGASELLSEHGLVSEKGEKFLSNIASETKRMEALINNLLELSSLESLAQVRTEDEVEIRSLVSQCIQQKRVSIESKNLSVSVTGSEEMKLRGDGVLLKLAISNLLQNAIEFSPVGGSIHIGLKSKDGLELTVSDQGPGIPEWVGDKVFEKFFSLPRPDSGRKSSGIGLTLTRKIAVLHGGDCRVLESAQGASIQMQIPFD